MSRLHHYNCWNYKKNWSITVKLYIWLRIVHVECKQLLTFFPGDKRSEVLAKAERNLFTTCILLVVLYICSNTFNFTMFFLYYIDADRFEHLYVGWPYHLSEIMVLFNSICNPFIYSIRYHEFQECLLHFFKLSKNV